MIEVLRENIVHKIQTRTECRRKHEKKVSPVMSINNYTNIFVFVNNKEVYVQQHNKDVM